LFRPEQFIEQISEPRLEHTHFRIRDRHILGPIVCDGPSRRIMTRPTPGARPRLVLDVKVGRRDANIGAPKTVFAAQGALPGHCDRIARSAPKSNSSILRQHALWRERE
jgi:hypothetical protein